MNRCSYCSCAKLLAGNSPGNVQAQGKCHVDPEGQQLALPVIYTAQQCMVIVATEDIISRQIVKVTLERHFTQNSIMTLLVSHLKYRVSWFFEHCSSIGSKISEKKESIYEKGRRNGKYSNIAIHNN